MSDPITRLNAALEGRDRVVKGQGRASRSATRRILGGVAALIVVTVGIGGASVLQSRNAPTLRVQLGSRAVSKLPFLLAADQGLYEKYGLTVDLNLPPADFEGAVVNPGLAGRVWRRLLRGPWETDVYLNGATPEVVSMVNDLNHPRFLLLASTDCVVRSHIIARHGIQSLEELRGMRIGVTGIMHNITSYVALELADRMGWDPVKDVSIILNGADPDDLREGRVDAIVARERHYAELQQEGFPVLLDTRSWGDVPVGGNSVRVPEGWVEEEQNREAMRRFMMALVEAMALLHEDRGLALEVLQRWNGVPLWYAEIMYDRAAFPRIPYPCYEGIRRTMDVYDSHEMRKYEAEDFYDDRILRELEESGFIDQVYADVRGR